MKNCKHKEVDTADLCEVVHTITAEICKAKGIIMDIITKYDGTRYTAKAQRIFDRYFDLLDNTFRN